MPHSLLKNRSSCLLIWSIACNAASEPPSFVNPYPISLTVTGIPNGAKVFLALVIWAGSAETEDAVEEGLAAHLDEAGYNFGFGIRFEISEEGVGAGFPFFVVVKAELFLGEGRVRWLDKGG